MNVIKVTIFIVVIIVLLSLIKRYIAKFLRQTYGGEFAVASHNEEKSRATPSQIAISNLSYNERQRLLTINENHGLNEFYLDLLDRSADRLKSFNGYEWEGDYYMFDTATHNINTPKSVSDAYIDLLAILTSVDVLEAAAVTEWKGDSFCGEGNDFITIYDRTHKPCLRFEKVNESSVVDGDALESFKEWPKDQLEAIDAIGIQDAVIDDGNINAIIENAIKCNGVTRDSMLRTFKWPSSDISVFIEFVYETFDSVDLYYKIHYRTAEILKYVFSQYADIMVFRLVVRNGFVQEFDPSKVKIKELRYDPNYDDTIKVLYYDGVHKVENTLTDAEKNGFKTIRIPRTRIDHSLKYDEGLLVQTFNEKRYDIQIEHSENLGEHKSNIVEFIVRSLVRRYVRDKETVIRFLNKAFSYNVREGKLVYTLIDPGLTELRYRRLTVPFSYLYSDIGDDEIFIEE